MKRNSWAGLLGSMGDRKLLSFSLVLFTLAVGIVIGSFLTGGAGAAPKEKAAADAKLLTIPAADPVENQFAKIADIVSPSVVNIRVETLEKPQTSRRRGGDEQPGQENMEDFFRRFFGVPEGPGGGGNSPLRERPRPGEGSGVIVDEHGYIITNHHVVDGADRIRVRLFSDNDDLFDAKLIGSDPETDLAVIKIDAGHPLAPAKMGNSDAVNVGDWAVAVGSPFGFRETVTVGIISAKGREVFGGAARQFQKFLQTDAAINPGNSGGPLVNVRGEVVGINTAIVSRSGGYEGLGFALMSNIAVEVYNDIVRYGRPKRGSIGISYRSDQHPALLRSYGAPDGGVLVTDVTENGPAQKAGMKPEDVIVEIDGKPIHDGNALLSIVAETPIDKTVPIVVVRDGKKVTLNVNIADRQELFGKQLGLAAVEEPEEEAGTELVFGITAENLRDDWRKESGYEKPDGVLVTTVDPASFAEDIGLRPGDVIVALNRRPVSSIEDIKQIQQSLKPGDDVAFKVERNVGALTGRPQWTTIYLAGVLRKPSEDRF
jgi:serine protease Do